MLELYVQAGLVVLVGVSLPVLILSSLLMART